MKLVNMDTFECKTDNELNEIKTQEQLSASQIQADIDYLSAMGGIEL